MRKEDVDSNNNNNNKKSLLHHHREQKPHRCRVIKPSSTSSKSSENAHLKDYLVASAFAGIGGMDRGFQLAGFDVVVQIENDKWCRRVLEKRFGNFGVERFKSGDIRDVKVLPAGVKVLLVTPPCVDLSAMNQFRVGIHGEETGKIREVFRILEAMRKEKRTVPIVVIENVLDILSEEAMAYLIQEFYKLNYDFLAWRTVDLLGALPHSRNRVILVATRDGINPHDILFEANPECECEKVRRRRGEKKGNEYSSSSAICALCQCSDDAPTIQDIGVICNTGQVNQAPSYHKNPCLLTSSASTFVCEFRRKNSKKRKFEHGKDDGNDDDKDGENPFHCYPLDIRDMERLMGFPEEYTKIESPSKNDRGRRVKLLANAVAVNHSEWIAQGCSNAIRNKIEREGKEEEEKEKEKKKRFSSSFLATQSEIKEKFMLRRENGKINRVSSHKNKKLPECGLIDLRSNLDEILTPKEEIHKYPVLNTYVPLPKFLRYKDTRMEDEKKRRLFKYAERLLQHWDLLEYWFLAALVPDDAQRRGLLHRFGDKVALNDDNIDILNVADFKEAVDLFCERKGDLSFLSENENWFEFLDVNDLAKKMEAVKKKSDSFDHAPRGKLVFVNEDSCKRKKVGNMTRDVRQRCWPAIALTFPEHATKIKATMKKFKINSIISTRDVFVCYFNRKDRPCEWVHENRIRDEMSRDEFFGNDSQIGEIFYEDVERKKAFASANLWWRGMRKRNRNFTLDSANASDDGSEKWKDKKRICRSVKDNDVAIGTRVDVYWPKDKKYYRGIVHAFDAKSQRRHVVYDDGDEEKRLDFDRERILLPLWDKSQVTKLDRNGGYRFNASMRD
jgi:site-specific DNA-cytosine methylase